MPSSTVLSLNERSREVFQRIVEAFVETGEPVGSQTLSRRLDSNLSPATIRNVMADLEDVGLLFAPHTSAGRLPTDLGLRMFVDGLMEVGGDLSRDERESLEVQCLAAGRTFSEVLEEAGSALSGLTECAGLVISPKSDAPLRQIEFVPLARDRALVVMVTDGGMVENRVIDIPPGLPVSSLVKATNYVNHRLANGTMDEARSQILTEIEAEKTELDVLTNKLVADGVALWAGGVQGGSLILRGQSKLLHDLNAIEDLERIRTLFEALERKESMVHLLDATGLAEGVQIFIGSENKLFENAGCSMIIAPYHDQQRKVVGALGVIGPTRMNYARVIPMVDYTSKLIGRILD
ncbi:MAG: heat-inducible transcriptional repressor HrcA [Rhodospirillaceae bacterium]|nr:heat-inducible transcriptional repressor HrcA [Rhodospirillaceae bacterium]